jgi:bifunctional non-homologous end joining protein LigD
VIPQPLREQVAQLAQPSKDIAPTADEALIALDDVGSWWFDIKWDGIRCLAYVEDGEVQLINRRQRDITFRYPDIVEALAKAYAGTSVVLDGEIVAFDAEGNVDFPAMHRRDAQENERSASILAEKCPATYVAFDILFGQGHDYRGLPYAARRGLLVTESARLEAVPERLQVSPSGKDGLAMWAMVLERRLEGLIAKAHNSMYRGGRSSNWVKIKPVKSVTAIVSGYDYGDKDSKFEHTMGALHLALLNDATEFVPIGKVGTGFTEADRDWFRDALDAQNVLLVEVEYQEVSPNLQLRFPSYKGVRTDVDLLSATMEQLR